MEPSDKMYGHRARIGYTSPPLTTEIFPYEFYQIAPPGVSLAVTSLAIVDRSKDEVDRSYDISMRAARAMAANHCDLICLGGVPINMSRGAANAKQMIVDLETELGVKISTSASAQERALERLGANKMVLCHPYEESETQRLCSYAEHFGAELLGGQGWGSPFNQIARIPQDAALIMGRALMKRYPSADIILMPSPHWPTIGAIDPLEQEFGVTVMSVLQVIVWDALRRCGINDQIEGYGRLLREF